MAKRDHPYMGKARELVYTLDRDYGLPPEARMVIAGLLLSAYDAGARKVKERCAAIADNHELVEGERCVHGCGEIIADEIRGTVKGEG